MGQRQAEALGGAGPAERGGGVALNDHQLRRGAAPVALQRVGDVGDVGERIVAARAAKSGRGQPAKTVIGKVEPRMLASRIKVNGDARAQQLERDGRELDGFGPGSDDETNTNRLQFSPWLRRCQSGGSSATRQAQFT